MNKLKSLVIEAQKNGLFYLNDIKEYVINKCDIPKEKIEGKIYDILKEQDKGQSTLAEQIIIKLERSFNER